MVDVPKKAKAFGGKIRRKPNQKGAKASTRVILNAPPKRMPEPREVVQTGRWNEEPGNPKRTPAKGTPLFFSAPWSGEPNQVKA